LEARTGTSVRGKLFTSVTENKQCTTSFT